MGRHRQGDGEGRQGQGNGEASRRYGPREAHRYGHLENRREKAERLANEATKRISELERQVAVSRRVAQSAINLLRPMP